MRASAFRLLLSACCVLLSACSPADPGVVARAVQGTLAAIPTQTPAVIVVTVLNPVSVSPSPTTPTEPSATLAPPTVTPAPFPTSVGGNVLWRDDFTDPGQWSQSDDVAQRTAVANGQLTITLKLGDRFALTYNNAQRAADFSASVQGAPAAGCANRDRYGLLFRVQDGANYYLFDVNCAGQYRVAVVVSNTLTLLQTGEASVLPNGQSNTLGVQIQGASITVSINNASLATLTEATFEEGGFGLYAGSDPVAAQFTAVFDNLEVRALK